MSDLDHVGSYHDYKIALTGLKAAIDAFGRMKYETPSEEGEELWDERIKMLKEFHLELYRERRDENRTNWESSDRVKAANERRALKRAQATEQKELKERQEKEVREEKKAFVRGIKKSSPVVFRDLRTGEHFARKNDPKKEKWEKIASASARKFRDWNCVERFKVNAPVIRL